jgi:vacuolar-type H+-ATPase subunit E/Vma4
MHQLVCTNNDYNYFVQLKETLANVRRFWKNEKASRRIYCNKLDLDVVKNHGASAKLENTKARR